MNRPIETEDAPKPFSNYAQAIVVEAGSRHVFVSGQVGATPDGSIPSDPEQQHVLAWKNVLAILRAAGMTHTDIVDAHVFITDREHVSLYRQVRDRMLKGHKPAATLLVVAGLADPRLVMEVAVVAAAPAK